MSKFLFVIGAGRSGTKFLMNILNKSKLIHLAPEIHYFSSLIHDGFRKNFHKKISKNNEYKIEDIIYALKELNHFGTYWRRENNFDAENIKMWFSSNDISHKKIYTYLMFHDYEENAKNKSQLKYIGEKTPANIFHLGELRSWFPGAKFLFIYRDPINVLKSEVNKDLKPDYPLSKNNSLYPYGLVIFVFFEWLFAAVLALYYKSRDYTSVIIVSYESMEAQSVDVIRRLTDIIDIPFHEDLCAVEKVDSSFQKSDPSDWWDPPSWVVFLYKIFLGPIKKRLTKKSL